jgi:hypothetical protein
MLRTGKTQQYRREALPIAEARGNSTARLHPVQATRNSRGDGPAFTHSAARRCGSHLRLRNWPTPLEKPNWNETPTLDSTACWSRLPKKQTHQPAIIPLRSSARESVNWLRAYATAPENEQTRHRFQCGSAHGVGMEDRPA